MEQGRKAGPLISWPPAAASPRFEVDPLGHGLFTYTLLHGLGAIKAGDEPEEIAKLGLPATPISTPTGSSASAELDAYVSQNLKAIARVFPEIVVKREADLPVGKPRSRPQNSSNTRSSRASARRSRSCRWRLAGRKGIGDWARGNEDTGPLSQVVSSPRIEKGYGDVVKRVLLTGMSGTGKSTLIGELAARVQGRRRGP